MELAAVCAHLREELRRLGRFSVLLWEQIAEECENDPAAWLIYLKSALRASTPKKQLQTSSSAPSLLKARGVEEVGKRNLIYQSSDGGRAPKPSAVWSA
jgi:hypothetical protein